ncbi:zinc finger protein 70-like [Ornithodoros turicata]|uniref:zinc finger protein 70-like n=1 Tax=Ornithodoros turicata TaxID=34597 RepID=UPI00313945DB
MGEKPHKCDLCPAEFSTRAGLRRDRRTHMDEKPYKCDLCLAEFGQGERLLYHKRKHTGENPGKCDPCVAELSQSASLSCDKQERVGEKPHKCDLCTAEFTLKGSLTRYKRKHTEFTHQHGIAVSRADTHGREALQVQSSVPASLSESTNLQGYHKGDLRGVRGATSVPQSSATAHMYVQQ